MIEFLPFAGGLRPILAFVRFLSAIFVRWQWGIQIVIEGNAFVMQMGAFLMQPPRCIARNATLILGAHAILKTPH
jgi:hypothetical protein